jgi:DNA-binding MarR family transcriptional regulator
MGDAVTVTENDVVRAFYYVERWRPNSIEVLENIGKSAQEKDIELVYQAIRRQPNVMRSKLMRDYHLTKRDADLIVDTLDQRGLITRVRSGKSERYSAT